MTRPITSSAAAGIILYHAGVSPRSTVPSFWGSHSTMAVYRKYSTFSSVDTASASSTGHFCHVMAKAA